MLHVQIQKWYGRLGNNLFQLANAVHFAKETNSMLSYPVHSVIAQKTFCFQNSREIDPKSISLGESEIQKRNFTFFSKRVEEYNSYGVSNNVDYHHIFQSYLLHVLPHKDISLDYDILIHLRGGDVFKPRIAYEKIERNYIQSPLSYFLKILEKETPSKILIVAEDYLNPVLELLLQSKYKCFYQPGFLKEDINLILNTKKLIIGGHTSFSETLAKISSKLEKVYFPVYEGNPIPKVQSAHTRKDGINYPAYEPVYHRSYIVKDNWKYSRAQKKLMRNHNTADIHFVSDLNLHIIEKWETQGRIKYFVLRLIFNTYLRKIRSYLSITFWASKFNKYVIKKIFKKNK